MSRTLITDVTYSPAGEAAERDGLLGFVSFHVDHMVRVEGVMVRRTAVGRLALSFPRRRVDAVGEEQYFVRPVDDTARREVETQVFAALGIFQEGRR